MDKGPGAGRRFPTVSGTSIPAVTRDQMREADRVTVEEFRIDLVQMMENAGRALADMAVGLFEPATATVLAGGGGNGGGGLAAARHLRNRGVAVTVVPAWGTTEFGAAALDQLDILCRMGTPVSHDPVGADLVVDAVIGYSLRGDPIGRAAELIDWANEQTAPVLALDTPSGVDVTTGRVGTPCVRAEATMTLALPKIGLLLTPELTGRLFVADISVPRSAFETVGVHIAMLFERGPIIELLP